MNLFVTMTMEFYIYCEAGSGVSSQASGLSPSLTRCPSFVLTLRTFFLLCYSPSAAYNALVWRPMRILMIHWTSQPSPASDPGTKRRRQSSAKPPGQCGPTKAYLPVHNEAMPMSAVQEWCRRVENRRSEHSQRRSWARWASSLPLRFSSFTLSSTRELNSTNPQWLAVRPQAARILLL